MSERAGHPILDPAAPARLRRIGGERLLGEMIRLFETGAPARVAEARAAASAGDAEGMRATAHALKSTAGNLGLARLQAACRLAEAEAGAAAEAEAGAGSGTDLHRHAADMESEVSAALAALRREVAAGPGAAGSDVAASDAPPSSVDRPDAAEPDGDG